MTSGKLQREEEEFSPQNASSVTENQVGKTSRQTSSINSPTSANGLATEKAGPGKYLSKYVALAANGGAMLSVIATGGRQSGAMRNFSVDNENVRLVVTPSRLL